MRALNKTVLAGGKIYPAGTPATEELEALVTNPDHWESGDPEASDEPAKPRRQRKPKSED